MAESSNSEGLTWTVEEAAKQLGIGRTNAYRAVRSGQLPTVRFGRRVLVPRKAVEQMLDQAASDPSR